MSRYRDTTINFNTKFGAIDLSQGRKCGCPWGRLCQCGVGQRKRLNDPVCGKCEACLFNQRTLKKKGKVGLRKCLDSPEVAAQFVEIEIGGYTYRVLKGRKPKDKRLRKEFIEIGLQRLAVQSRTEELHAVSRKWSNRLQTYQSELETVDANTHIDRNRGACYVTVDTSVTHGAPQRMKVEDAKEALRAKIKEAKRHIQDASEELSSIDMVVKMRAIVHLQRTYKGKRARVRFQELLRLHREKMRQEAATLIQGWVRMIQAGPILAALKLKEKRRVSSIAMQRAFRGYVARKEYRRLVNAEIRRMRKRATVRIQTIIRKRRASQLFAGMKQRAALLAAMRRKAAAINIQRMVRGWIAKRRKHARKVELSLGPRVRNLCEKYIAKGDLYGFLQEVNRDYELQVAQQAEMRMLEVENARTFIREVLAWRENSVDQAWTSWQQQKGAQERLPRNLSGINPYEKFLRESEQNPAVVKTNRGGAFDTASWTYIETPTGAGSGDITHKTRTHSPLSLYRSETKMGRTASRGSSSSMRRDRPISRESKFDLLSQPANTPQSRLDLIRKKHEEKESRRLYIEKVQRIQDQKVVADTSDRGADAQTRPSSSSLQMRLTSPTAPLPVTPDDVIRRHKYAGSLGLGIASEIPSLDEPVDRLVLHAVLRTLVPAYMSADAGVTAEAAFEAYMLNAPSLLKVKHEMEAIQESVAHIDTLKRKGVTTCRKLSKRNIEECGIPPQLAKVMRVLLKELGGSLDTVRPPSVKKKWRIMSGEDDSVRGLLGLRPQSVLVERQELVLSRQGADGAKTSEDPRFLQNNDSPTTWNWGGSEMRAERPDTAATLQYDGPGSRQSSRGASWRPFTREMTPLENVNEGVLLKGSARVDAASEATSIPAELLRETQTRTPRTEQAFVDRIKTKELAGSIFSVKSVDDDIATIVVHATMKVRGVPHPAQMDTTMQYSDFLLLLARLEEKREVLRACMKPVMQVAMPFVECLKKNGFKSVGSLAACPMESLGVPEDIAACIRELFHRFVNKTTSHVADEFDKRYVSSAHDIRVSNARPLPPVRMKSKYPRADGIAARALERSKAIYSSSARPGRSGEESRNPVVRRILARGAALANSYEIGGGGGMTYQEYKDSMLI